jgi:hypothetical protein
LALHLIGLALPVALNLVYVLSIVGSALATYLLARDLFGPQAGIVAALAYAYAPYQFLNALLRANAPESLALPLMPLILWAFRRLALTGRRRWFLISVGSLVALYLTHNISSLLFTPFLVAYLFLLWLVYRKVGRVVNLAYTAGALVLALGLVAFFFGPALLEQDYAQLHMSRVTRNNNFRYNFLGLAEIFAPPTPVDTSLLNPPMRVHLGLAQAVLGGLGLVIGLVRWQHDRERRATLIFLALTTVAMLWMSTRSSLWLWENVPLLPFIQFPWRLVGRAILPLALLAAAAFSSPPANLQTCRPANLRTRLLPLASCILILSALPNTYPPHGYCANKPYPTINDVFAYERESKLVGVDPEGSYFPVWVKQRPEDSSPLEEQYAAGGSISRFDETVLPAAASIVEAEYGPNQAHIAVETPTPFHARYLAFYFPGWRVWIDDEPVQVTATDPEGLITFNVPAGTHTIAIRFGSTPIRTAGTIVSTLSLIALIIVTIRYPRMASGDRSDRTEWRVADDESLNGSQLTSYRSLFIVNCSLAILLLAFKLGVADRTDTIFRRPALQPDGSLPGIENVLNQPYADGMALIGHDQDRSALPADDELRIDLYWTTYTRPTARYQTVIHLVGDDGMRWSMPDTARPRGYANYPPNFTWSSDHYALDSHQVVPLSGTPPGDYDVVLTIFDRDTLAPLSVLNEHGHPAAPKLTLGQVTLTRPHRRIQVPEDNRLDISGSEVTLLTADFDRDQAAPGDTVHLTLMWQANHDYPYSQSSTYCNWWLTLVHPDGTDITNYWLPPSPGLYKEGDVLRSQHQLLIPATLETGTYTWDIEWCSIIKNPINRTSIVAPPRTYTSPSTDLEINTPLGNVATLVGANLEPETHDLEPSALLTVTLIWRAENTPSDSYRVFVHLLDPEGNLATQSDAIPAAWSRPTTGWLPGEYITDVHTLTIPPNAPTGDYTLSTGLYVSNGERLTTPDGADAIPLTTISVTGQ